MEALEAMVVVLGWWSEVAVGGSRLYSPSKPPLRCKPSICTHRLGKEGENGSKRLLVTCRKNYKPVAGASCPRRSSPPKLSHPLDLPLLQRCSLSLVWRTRTHTETRAECGRWWLLRSLRRRCFTRAHPRHRRCFLFPTQHSPSPRTEGAPR